MRSDIQVLFLFAHIRSVSGKNILAPIVWVGVCTIRNRVSFNSRDVDRHGNHPNRQDFLIFLGTEV